MIEETRLSARDHPAPTIRVLHLIYTLEGGGAEQQLRYLTQHTDPTRVENAVCVFDKKGLDKLKEPVQTFVVSRKHRFDFSFKEVREVYRSWRPDVIHIWLPSELIYGMPAALLERKKVVASFRGNYRLISLKRLLLLPFFLLAERIVSNIPEECLFTPYRQIYKMKNGVLIPNGFPVQELQNKSAADRLSKDADEIFRLLFVGRLKPVKNISLIFKALKILQSQGINCNLSLAGEGIQQQELVRLSREMDLDGSVSFLGYREDPARLMAQSDLLVLPSFREGMSNSLFEALASGLPVAASDIPVHRYWLRHDLNAVLFDPRDAADLARQISAIKNKTSAELQQMITSGQALVEELTAARMAFKYQEFYQELVGQE